MARARVLVPQILQPWPMGYQSRNTEGEDFSDSQKSFLSLLRKDIHAELKDFRSQLLREIRTQVYGNSHVEPAMIVSPEDEGPSSGVAAPCMGDDVKKNVLEFQRQISEEKRRPKRRSIRYAPRHVLKTNSEGDVFDTDSLLAPELDEDLELETGLLIQSQNVAEEVQGLTEDQVDWKLRVLAQIETMICFVIIFNAIVIGLEIDSRAKHPDGGAPVLYHIADRIFFVLFACELGFRLFVHGKGFFCMPDFEWNWFDFFLVIFQGIDVIMTTGESAHDFHNSSGVRVLRVFRILRLARVTRILRVFRLVDDLRNIMASIASSLRTLFWTLVLICSMVFITAIALTQMVVEALPAGEEDPGNRRMYELFGSVEASALTLYKCISTGTQWGDVLDILMEKSLTTVAFIFVIYVTFSLFALLNVVTASFVEKAFEGAHSDRDERLAANLVNVFAAGRQSASDIQISWPDFQHQTSTREVQEFLRQIDVAETDAEGLFQLLDTDDTGTVGLVELVSGCTRLKGTAKAIPLALHMKETRRFHHLVMTRFDMIENQFIDLLRVDISRQTPG